MSMLPVFIIQASSVSSFFLRVLGWLLLLAVFFYL